MRIGLDLSSMRAVKVWAFNSDSSHLKELDKVTSQGSSIRENQKWTVSLKRRMWSQEPEVCAQHSMHIFSFICYCKIVLQSIGTNLCCHQQSVRILVVLYPCQHLVLSNFRNLSNLMALQWYFILF